MSQCFYLHRSFSLAKSTIVANWAVVGASFNKDEEILIDSFSFSVERLDDWLKINNLTISECDDGGSKIVRYDQIGDIELYSNDKFRISLRFGYSLSCRQSNKITIENKSFFRVLLKVPAPVSALMELAHKLVSFVCFALDDIVSLLEINGFLSLSTQTDDRGNFRTPVTIYFGAIPYSEKEASSRSPQLLFSFQDIRDDASSVVGAWLAAYDSIDPVLGLYFFSKMRGQKYDQSRFLALSQAIETFHRRTSDETLMSPDEFDEALAEIRNSITAEHWRLVSPKLKYANELSLSKRIKDMLATFEDIFGQKEKRKRLCRTIVDARNYFTHYDGALSKKVPRNLNIWRLCLKMEILLQLHLLKTLQFPKERIENIAKQSNSIKRGLEFDIG